MSTTDVLQHLPTLYACSFFMGLVFRWQVQAFRYLKKKFASL